MMTQIESNDLFKSAYYICNGGTLADVRIVDSHQVRFLIKGENMNDVEQQFYNGQALVDPLRLKECINYLRELLRTKLNETNPKPQPKRRIKAHGSLTQNGF